MNYTVKNGDTLTSIAEQFNMPVEELVETNQLSQANLRPGMITVIPPIWITPGRPPFNPGPRPPLTPVPPIAPLPPQNIIYIVRRGDNIWTIARHFNVSVERIIAMNGLRFPFVFPGQRLIIPVSIMPFQN